MANRACRLNERDREWAAGLCVEPEWKSFEHLTAFAEYKFPLKMEFNFSRCFKMKKLWFMQLYVAILCVTM